MLIVPHEILLFFDEIQSCEAAIASLRYIYEKLPSLHLIAAGSLLEMAGLLIRVTHSSSNGLPLGASSNPKVFKLIPLDVGLCNKMSGLSRAKLLTLEQSSLINAGALMEVVVGLIWFKRQRKM